MMVSCSKNGPKSAAESFLTAISHMDYETAKKYATEDAIKTIDMAASFAGMMPDSVKNEAKKIKVNVTNVVEEGETATVTYNTSADATSKTLNMVKDSDGTWKANWNKADEGGMPSGPATTDTTPTNDTMAAEPVGEPGNY